MNEINEVQTHLVKQAIDGDTAAFGQLYERFLDEIYHFVFYRVRSHQEAEDLCEAVFLKAWLALAENPPQQIPFRLWLYRIARNMVVDHYRAHKEHVGLEEANHVLAPIEGPEGMMMRRERAEELHDKFQQLKEEYQEVLTYRFIVGLSHAETAVVLQRSEEAVRALQYRAITALRNLLTVAQVAAPGKTSTRGNGFSPNLVFVSTALDGD